MALGRAPGEAGKAPPESMQLPARPLSPTACGALKAVCRLVNRCLQPLRELLRYLAKQASHRSVCQEKLQISFNRYLNYSKLIHKYHKSP